MKLQSIKNLSISKRPIIYTLIILALFCLILCLMVQMTTFSKEKVSAKKEEPLALDMNLKHAKSVVKNLKAPKKPTTVAAYKQSVKDSFAKTEDSFNQSNIKNTSRKSVHISKVLNYEDYLKEYVLYKEKNNLTDRGFEGVRVDPIENVKRQNNENHLQNIVQNHNDKYPKGLELDKRYESYKDALKAGTKVSLNSLKREITSKQEAKDSPVNRSPMSVYQGLENHDTQLLETVQKPKTPYALMQGSVVRATLLTGINSSLPGQIVALINQNVYDSIQGNYLLIPKGSRLIGQYDTRYAYGEKRLFLGFNRVIFPNGHSLNLGAMPGQSTDGYAGLNAEVENHLFTSLINSFFVSSIRSQNESVAANLSSRENLSEQDRLALDFAKESSQNMTNILSRDVNLSPTLTVKPGFSFALAITKDIFFDAPYGVTKREIKFK